MVKDPRSDKPGSSEPEETLDLLRALARSRGSSPSGGPDSPPTGQPDEKLDALRALAEKLDFQLRSPGASGPAPQPPFAPGGPPAEQLASSADDDVPPRRAWADQLRQSARREWRALMAALPERSTLVPHFDRPRFVFIGVAVGVLLIAAIGAFVGPRAPRAPTQANTQAPSASQTAPSQVVPPLAPAMPAMPASDLASITKSMSDCDAEATREPNSLHFLVMPLVPAKSAENDWRSLALQEVGNTFLLLSAKDALDGLRDGKLTVRPGRFTFAVLDSATGKSFSWTSATSISRLSRPVDQEVKSLKLGFDFSAAQSGPQWRSEFRRDPGTCYWVSVLVRP